MSDLIPALAPPLASFTWLLREKWDSRTQFLALPADLPILLLSGRKDEIVPSKHMDELAKIANMRDHGNGKQKTVLKKFLEGNHSAYQLFLLLTFLLALKSESAPSPRPPLPDETVAQKGYFEEVMKFMESQVGRLPRSAKAGQWRGKRFEETK